MRACDIDVKNHVVEEYSMTWENVEDTFLSEKSCFQNSMIPNMKKERYLLLFTCVCFGRQIWLQYWIAYGLCHHQVPSCILTLPSLRAHPHIPVSLGRSSLCLWIDVLPTWTKISRMCVEFHAQIVIASTQVIPGTLFLDKARLLESVNEWKELWENWVALVGRIFQRHGAT